MRAISAILLVLVSCNSVKHIPSTGTLYGIDFRKYTSEGFLITPEKYDGRYESIGLVRYTIFAEANYHPDLLQWVSEEVSLSQGVDSLYYESKDMGADAIMNFSTQETTKTVTTGFKAVTLIGYEVSGFAIKRKD